MKFLNVAEESFPFNLSSLEKEANVEFIVGHGIALTPAFATNAPKQVKTERPPVLLIIDGFIKEYEKKMAVVTPARFSYHYESIENFPNIGVKVFPDSIYKKDFKPLVAPSGNIFGSTIFLSNNVICLHFDMMRVTKKKYAEKILSYFLRNGLFNLNLLPEPQVFDEKENNDHVEQNIQQYIKRITVDVENKLEEKRSKLTTLSGQIRSTLSEIQDLSFILEGKSSTERMIDEMEKIRQMPGVEWVDLKDEVLRFLYRDVKIQSKDKLYDIGDIIIGINLTNMEVNFDNITRKVAGFKEGASHPHDIGNGKMCLGELSSFVPQLATEMQFAYLAESLINFANSVNVDDSAGRSIVKWPSTSIKKEVEATT